jgi:hypothetical protein
VSRLADYARLEESAGHADVFFLGPSGAGVRTFFLDADLAVTKSVQSWLQVVRRKWKGFMNEGDPTAISMTITGTPKARPLFSLHHARAAHSVLQTGKSLLLNKVLPALIAADELFGVGSPAEARVFRLSTDKFDRKNGETGFLSSLLDELTVQADAMGIVEVRRVREEFGDLGVVARLTAFVNFLPHTVPHFILLDEVQNFFLLTKPDGTLDGSSVDQMQRCARVSAFLARALSRVLRNRIFKPLVGSSPIHCTWVLTGSSMATYWANLALAPVNGYSILTHLSSVHVPTRVEASVLERARSVLREEFASVALPLPESLLQFEFANTVAELVFYVTEWSRLPSTVTSTKSPAEFCMDTLADKVYPEVRFPHLLP